jgi:hypothetical protein
MSPPKRLSKLVVVCSIRYTWKEWNMSPSGRVTAKDNGRGVRSSIQLRQDSSISLPVSPVAAVQGDTDKASPDLILPLFEHAATSGQYRTVRLPLLCMSYISAPVICSW